MTACWPCRAPVTPLERTALGRLDLATLVTVPVCARCQAALSLTRLQAEACNEENAQVRADTGLELVCRRAPGHAPPHRDGLWFWSAGTPETRGGWDLISETDVREAMRA